MMGPKQEAQAALFYKFSLEDHVPQDHLFRSIDRFVDLSDIRQCLFEFYSHTGRPSRDPELLIRLLLVGYCFGIRSECRLCEEVHLNLAYRWFCSLYLSDSIPNDSTFSKNRHGRFRESALLRHLFEKTVARCIADGLVSGQRLAADASLIEADVNKQNSTPKEDWHHSAIDPNDAPPAVKEYLDVLDDAAFVSATYTHYVADLNHINNKKIYTHNATHNETSDQNRINQGLLCLISIVEIEAYGPHPAIIGPRVSDHGPLVLAL